MEKIFIKSHIRSTIKREKISKEDVIYRKRHDVIYVLTTFTDSNRCRPYPLLPIIAILMRCVTYDPTKDVFQGYMNKKIFNVPSFVLKKSALVQLPNELGLVMVNLQLILNVLKKKNMLMTPDEFFSRK